MLVLFSRISAYKHKFTLRLLLLMCFLYSWFLGWLICFYFKFFSLLLKNRCFWLIPFSASLHFPFSLLSPPLSCSLLLVLGASVTFPTFFSWRGKLGLRAGGQLLSVKGGKGKTKRGCLLAGQAGNANLPGLSPSRCSLTIMLADSRLRLTAPLSPCSTVPFVHPFPLFALEIFFLFSSLVLVFYLNMSTYIRTSTTSMKWVICSKSLPRVTNLYLNLHNQERYQ